LRREDAERLGYDSANAWRGLLRSFAPELAEAFKIAPERLRWYAAYHDEGTHPHVHMVIWSSELTEGFLTKQGLRQIKSGLAAQIFRDDLLHVYERQTQARTELGERSRALMSELIAEMQSGELQNEHIEQLISELSARLKRHNGKKQYGYLQASDKRIVDAIADELCNDGRVADCYRLWCEAKREIAAAYSSKPPASLPLSKQPELKRIRNIVIEEAAAATANVKLTVESVKSDDTASDKQQDSTVNAADSESNIREAKLNSATRLLRHIGNIFRENLPAPERRSVTERKLLRKLRQKKTEQGHAEDERGQTQTY
jgi:hypothetical protein